MAYGLKYRFKFESASDVTTEIRVLLDGYEGEVLDRALGRAPVLKRQQNDRILGTSLEFYAECLTDGEFAELYTSNPRAFMVTVLRNDTAVWSGFISPELYSEPDIAPPYDVDIIATDGLGELKLYEYEKQGLISLDSQLEYLLSFTGIWRAKYYINPPRVTDPVALAWGSFPNDCKISLDHMAGKTCYEVLQYLMTTLNARLTFIGQGWAVIREYAASFSAGNVGAYLNGILSAVPSSGKSIGQMGVADMWPIGNLTTRVVPAKKKVAIKAPWYSRGILGNPDMETDSAWVTTPGARQYSSSGQYYTVFKYTQTIGSQTQTVQASLSQTVTDVKFAVPFLMSVVYGARGSQSSLGNQLDVKIIFTTTGGNVYSIKKNSDGTYEWKTGSSNIVELPIGSATTNRDAASRGDISIPSLTENGTAPSGTLAVEFSQNGHIFHCQISPDLGKGWQEIVNIDNGARGESGEVEVAGGYVTSDVSGSASWLDGIFWVYDEDLDPQLQPVTGWSDALYTTDTFLELVAIEASLDVALPRLQIEGTLFMGAGILWPPLVLWKGETPYWVDTYEWNMDEDELTISATSSAAASLTTLDEKIEIMK